jgi:3'(2'), 5'-bisphosphate nucleotidase
MENLNLALKAALLAGNEILKIYNGIIEFELKHDNSPLTIADKQSHDIIKLVLEESQIPVISEEEEIPYHIRKDWLKYWLVDPLDGTKEFIKKNGQFTVNIALINNGIPELGVVYAPALNKIYWTSSPNNSYTSEITTISKSHVEILASKIKIESKKNYNPYTIVKSLSHSNQEDELKLHHIIKEQNSIEYKSIGSSLKFCLLATGEAQLYPRFGPTMEWDTAAGHIIAMNSGCKIYQFETKEPLIYNKEDLLNPAFIVEA